MNILDVIDQLTEINKKYGNLPCVVEIEIDYGSANVLLGEISVEDREGFGLSAKFMM